MSRNVRTHEGRRSQMTRPLRVGSVLTVPLADGRLGACRVIRVRGAEVLVAATQWLGEAPPDIADPRLRLVLAIKSFDWNKQPRISWVDEPPPRGFQHIGTVAPSAEERRFKCKSFSHWNSFAESILQEWRWEHDRQALIIEHELEDAQFWQAVEHERTKRLKNLTWAKLRKQRPLTNWAEYLPARIVRESQKIWRETIDQLAALGRKPDRRAVMRLLRNCVERFNNLNEEYDHFIDTLEREDIFRHFEELVHLSGLKDADELIDRWRKW
jgi:hypothetical protein